jgi:hypothetical protein
MEISPLDIPMTALSTFPSLLTAIFLSSPFWHMSSSPLGLSLVNDIARNIQNEENG